MSDQKRKRYYTISEVSTMLGIKSHILRYWEGEFPTLRPRKNRAGNRAYTEHDIAVASQIKRLLYEQRFTIEGAKKQIREREDVPPAGNEQLAIPFERLRVQHEIQSIRHELVRLVEEVKKL